MKTISLFMRTQVCIGALLTGLALASSSTFAGTIQIDFVASISNDGGATTDDVSGQFTLDTSTAFGVDAGAVDGVIDSGTAVLFGQAQTVDTQSAFTFASATSLGGALSLIGDYGGGLFSLELSSDLFFPSNNVFDVLTEDLLLDSLRSFDALQFGTRFVHFANYAEEWTGALTSLSVIRTTSVPEPSSLLLLLIASLYFLRPQRRGQPGAVG